MGCIQDRESEDSWCGLVALAGMTRTHSGQFSLLNREVRKPSEILEAAECLPYKMRQLYLKPLDEIAIKELDSHFNLGIKEYIQNPDTFVYISGQVETKFSYGFTNKATNVETGQNACSSNLSKKGIGYTCRKGNKPTPNQDDFFILLDGNTTILGVFDGHGLYGHSCSSIVQQLIIKFLLTSPYYIRQPELALKQAFAQCDEALRGLAIYQGQFSILLSGTTATVLLRRGDDYYVAHVGDSRAIIGKVVDGKTEAPELTQDHCPNLPAELLRIEQSGGEVFREDSESPMRVFFKNECYPGLAMSRALGDDVAKCVGVIPEPEIYTGKIADEDQFVVIASDGVWEFLQNEKVAEIIADRGKDKVGKSALKIAEKAYKEWIQKENGTADDITCIIYYLQ